MLISCQTKTSVVNTITHSTIVDYYYPIYHKIAYIYDSGVYKIDHR